MTAVPCTCLCVSLPRSGGCIQLTDIDWLQLFEALASDVSSMHLSVGKTMADWITLNYLGVVQRKSVETVRKVSNDVTICVE